MFILVNSGDYDMPFPVVRQLPYKIMSKFDKLVDFTLVKLYHVRCAISEDEDANAETTG